MPPELRRFILDQLADIEASELKSEQTPAGAYSHTSSVLSESTDSVALKILEGLKKRETLVPKVSDITKRKYVAAVMAAYD